MKKILFYIDSLYRGGAQRVMSNLVAYFSNNYDVVLVNDFVPDNQKVDYDLPVNIKKIYLRKSPDGNPVTKNISRIIILRKTIIKENPDTVLSFLGNPNKRMLIATIGLKCRKVVSVRNDPSHEYGGGNLSRWFARRLFSRADGVVFQTQDASKYFQKSVQNKSTIIMNPVSKQFYQVNRCTPEKDVVTVGRFEAQKNHLLLLQAWKEIEQSFPDDHLIIYGDGSLRKEYEEYIQEQGLNDRVLLPGIVKDIPQKLASAKLFVLSSDFEGMPNALMEAMAVGLPVISTDCPCGGPRMLIQDLSQGILVPCKDVNALKKAMKELLGNIEERKHKGLSAKTRANAFAEDSIYGQWEDFLMINNAK